MPSPAQPDERRELERALYDRLIERAQAFVIGQVGAPCALAYDPASDVLSPLKSGRHDAMCRLAQDALRRGRLGAHPRVRLFVVDPARSDVWEAYASGDEEGFYEAIRDQSWVRPGARSRRSALAYDESPAAAQTGVGR